MCAHACVSEYVFEQVPVRVCRSSRINQNNRRSDAKKAKKQRAKTAAKNEEGLVWGVVGGWMEREGA